MANNHKTLASLFSDTADAIREKQGSSGSKVADNFPAEIRKIVSMADGTNDATAVAADIVKDKTAYVKGEKVVGAFVPVTQPSEDLDAEMATQDALISQIFEAIVVKSEAIEKGSGGGGIDGGYSVTFVDLDGTTAAVFSVISGRAINAPVSGAPYWTDETGVRVSFPYTPVTDVVLDADTQTYADRLYERFSVSPSEYPIILGRFYGDGVTYAMVYFATSVNANGNLYIHKSTSGRVTTSVDRNSPEDFVSYFENNEFTLDSSAGIGPNIKDNGYPNAFVNFSMTEYAPDYTGTVIDLNQ